jgi:hypothetical protein
VPESSRCAGADPARGLEGRISCIVVEVGESLDRVPDHAVTDAERVQEVRERDAAPGAKGGVRTDEREILLGDRPPAHEARPERVIVLGDVLGHVRQDHRIVDIPVGGDRGSDRGEALGGKLGPARRQHRGDALDGHVAGHEHGLRL